MSKVKEDARITFRAPTTLRETVKEFIQKDMHMNESDFYRDAAREKIRSDAPELYRRLFEKNDSRNTDDTHPQQSPSAEAKTEH